ncbi:MAG: nidogen-like domain-containing protein [Deltaproteobacteria bacterium]|nr:nidogen-like domain-containing protein [Deltaproteobacteria bacterium]
MKLRLLAAAACCAAAGLLTGTAHAQTSLISTLGGPQGFGTQCLSPNDDSSSRSIDLRAAFPMGLRFFTSTHTSMVVNTNGNITFSGAVSRYTPSAFPVASQPMIAPFWADVDLRTGSSCTPETDGGGDGTGACRNPSDNGVWWNLEPGRVTVTWHRVGYYKCHTDRRMNFQLLLTDASVCGGEAGDFDVEFRYNLCDWHTGDQSGGAGGLCAPPPPPPFPPTRCVPAQAGFDAGDTRNFVSIMNSMTEAISSTLCRRSNVGDPGVWRFQIRRGAVLCPDAGRPCSTGMMGACGEGRTACEGNGQTCRVINQPRSEACDGVDNDCNGSVDDNAVCPAGQRCLRGSCVSSCVEGDCFDGFACVRGECVERGCETLECPAGQRCAAGRCVGACDGVVCPVGQICRAGRCFDPCAGVTCAMGQVCEVGVCVPGCGRCRSCTEGLACRESDGRCVLQGCQGVSCTAPQVCRAGACVGPCDGVVCPAGESCREGQCVASASPGSDGGGPVPGADGGTVTGPDGGTVGMDGGGGGGLRPASGCACRAGTKSPTRRGWVTLVLTGALALSATRRRRRV